MTIKPIPEGYEKITPYLMIKGAAKAIDFYKKAFGATELFRLDMPDGLIGHAEIMIDGSPIMMADDCGGEGDMQHPKALKGTSIGLHLYVRDVDARFEQAVKAGATVVRSVEDQFYGDRTGMLEDPFGHRWFLASRVEELTPEEIEQRAATLNAAPAATAGHRADRLAGR